MYWLNIFVTLVLSTYSFDLGDVHFRQELGESLQILEQVGQLVHVRRERGQGFQPSRQNIEACLQHWWGRVSCQCAREHKTSGELAAKIISCRSMR